MENEENAFPRTDKNRPRSTTCVSLIATRRNMSDAFLHNQDPELPSSTAVFCDALRGIAINHKRVKQLTLRRHWAALATPRRGVAKIAAPGLELRSGLISRILSRRHAWEHSAARPAPMPWLVHDASARTRRG